MLNVGHLKSLHNQVGDNGVHNVLNNSLSQLQVTVQEHLNLTSEEEEEGSKGKRKRTAESNNHNPMFQVAPPHISL